MKAAEITDQVIAELRTGAYRHARLNWANGDMVGHTGVRDSAIQAVEAVDLQVGRLIPVIEQLKGALIVTADHGNADCMFEMDKKSGEPRRNADGNVAVKTSHTLNPVPLYVYAPGHSLALRDTSKHGAGLANIAATVLQLLGLRAPDDYEDSLLAD